MELSYIGVQEKKEKQFRKKGITCVEDLIRFVPRKYYDFTSERPLVNGEMNCLVVHCSSVKYINSRAPRIEAECILSSPGAGDLVIKAVWFNQPFMYRQLRILGKKDVLLCGTVSYDPGSKTWRCVNPVIFKPALTTSFCVYPIYSKIPGMSDDYLCEKISQALVFNKWGEDLIPGELRSEFSLPNEQSTYELLHHPKSMEDVRNGRRRLDFEEMLYFALKTESNNRMYSKGSQYGLRSLKLYRQMLEKLPYELTDDQRHVVDALLQNIREGRRLSALIQGDVSCGKTVVAFLVAAALAGSGYQAAIMAPTQVLAEQHFNELSSLLDGTDIKCAFYGGASMKAKEKKNLLSDIASGAVSIVVGTHSLLNDEVRYKDLAITIVDEEHKFGVQQKQALVDKASSGVHSISMSATPIPRTLAQVVYGDTIDVFSIHQMPGGRKRVRSCISDKTEAIHKFLKKELDAGHQAYVVCPAIDPNEKRESLKSVKDAFKEYDNIFGSYGVAALTGKNSKAETERIIRDFKDNRTKILVSTTVIEVGVNVPNATVIIIENAENFGLAGLHQLRGRVGRGDAQSYCILRSSESDNPRLNAIMSTNDGFKIAEKDLQLRGTGEFIGTRQSGVDSYITVIFSSKENEELHRRIKTRVADIVDSGICDAFIEGKDKQ
ncbi:MAG: ATP-dependent DNA helicase RecG, partial [Lachnospiraceae bacterium]|nr:ATP-dependent DNA helicase RecG [Lachnospiraceae bacterium]